MTGVDELVGLFPPGTSLDADGMLVVGGCRLDDLAHEHGTPVLVVDEVALRQRARSYLAAADQPLVGLAGGLRVQGVPVDRGPTGDGGRGALD